ncbi:MAG: helix-turn-helix transcriptional regulator, partial [[Bacteroides] pectinophilus]|nr:helix-turn-helix transcriptional regulator [[Bacteroides] pectinophilus]
MSLNTSTYTAKIIFTSFIISEQKKLSTNKLANLAGVSQSYLRDVELGNKNPTVEFITLLCRALGISLAEFFSEDTASTLINDPLITRIYRLTP